MQLKIFLILFCTIAILFFVELNDGATTKSPTTTKIPTTKKVATIEKQKNATQEK